MEELKVNGRGYAPLTDRNSQLGRANMLGFRTKVNSGSATKFWDHLRLGDEVLKSVYPRLYILRIQKEAMIRDVMGSDRGGAIQMNAQSSYIQ